MSGPDFVIIGVPCTEGVMVLGSTELSEAELRAEADEPEFTTLRAYRSTRTRYVLSAELRGYTVAIGLDYPTAFARLFAQWTAPHRGRLSSADQAYIIRKELQ